MMQRMHCVAAIGPWGESFAYSGVSLPLSYVVSLQPSFMAQDDVSVAGMSVAGILVVVLYLPRLAIRCIFLDTTCDEKALPLSLIAVMDPLCYTLADGSSS
jgi:hypothetical protein